MQPSHVPSQAPVVLRTRLEPGDVGSIVHLHGVLYAREYGFDPTFEAYVAAPLAEYVLRGSDREQVWIAARDGEVVGCVAIVSASPRVAQLRWFLVHPSARGMGLGRTLLRSAIEFSRDKGYASIILWTVSALHAAARLYGEAGFRKVLERPGSMWGVDVVEEKHELHLEDASA